MENHSFNKYQAAEYGLLEAILIRSFEYWIEKNAANDKNFYQGRYWTYNSVRAFAEIFPYASDKKIRRALEHLVELGIIITGEFNKNAYDHTKWYAFSDWYNSILQKKKFDLPKKANRNTQKGEPIPNTNTINKPNTKHMSQPAKPAATCAPEALKLAKKLYARIIENKPNRRIDKHWLDNWPVDIDKLHRIDGRSWKEIETAIDWSQDSAFWKGNILSGNKLRKQIDTLEDQMAREEEDKPLVIDADNI